MTVNPIVGEDALRGLIRLSRQAETTLVEFSLSLAQYRVLDRLAGGRAAGKSLAEWLAVRPPTVTAIVDGLVARDLVQRRVDEDDRRRVTHELTPTGRSTYEAVSAAIAQRLSHIAGNANTEAEGRRMVTALGEWNAAMGRTASRHAAPSVQP